MHVRRVCLSGKSITGITTTFLAMQQLNYCFPEILQLAVNLAQCPSTPLIREAIMPRVIELEVSVEKRQILAELVISPLFSF